MKVTNRLMLSALLSSTLMTGCATNSNHQPSSEYNVKYNGVTRSVMLGALSGAATQVNGNSADVKNGAGVGALIGLLNGIFR